MRLLGWIPVPATVPPGPVGLVVTGGSGWEEIPGPDGGTAAYFDRASWDGPTLNLGDLLTPFDAGQYYAGNSPTRTLLYPDSPPRAPVNSAGFSTVSRFGGDPPGSARWLPPNFSCIRPESSRCRWPQGFRDSKR